MWTRQGFKLGLSNSRVLPSSSALLLWSALQREVCFLLQGMGKCWKILNMRLAGSKKKNAVLKR
jgi:hypothetical protein